MTSLGGVVIRTPKTITYSSLQPRAGECARAGGPNISALSRRHFKMAIRPIRTPKKTSLLCERFLMVEFSAEHRLSTYSPVNMAGIFLDDVAELARAHHASSARTSLRCYIREHSPSRHLDLSLCGQKWVCLTESPSPTSPYRDCVNQHFSRFASVSFSLFEIALSLRSEAPGPGGSAARRSHFSVSY